MSGGLQALKNEIDSIRCYSSLFQSDGDICRELLTLREFRDRHPMPESAKPAVGNARPKSSVIRHAEAKLIFGEYCDLEARRLAVKASALELGTWTFEAGQRDEAERLRNEKIAQRAIVAEEEAGALWTAECSRSQPSAPAQPDLLIGLFATPTAGIPDTTQDGRA